MACFCTIAPYAFHVFPLHAAKPIYTTKTLLSKRALAASADARTRSTTSGVDRALGFDGYVHLYLPRQRDAGLAIPELPILRTQLTRTPPFPHVLLMLPTGDLSNAECMVCCWNIAVSRPGVEGHCQPGNWTRGTNPDRIREVWRLFRNAQPTREEAKGFWLDDIEVPVVPGERLLDNMDLLRKGPFILELLMRSPWRIPNSARWLAFSGRDLASLKQLDPAGPWESGDFPGYSDTATDSVTDSTRSAIDLYLSGRAPFPAHLDFDGK